MVAITRKSSLSTCPPLPSPSPSSSQSPLLSSSVKQERDLHEKQANINDVINLGLSLKQGTSLNKERKTTKAFARDAFPSNEEEKGEQNKIHPTLQDDYHEKAADKELETPVSALKSSYESLRLQRIAENNARLAALGVKKHAEKLTSYFSVSKPGKRPWKKSPIPPMELRRRSERLKNNTSSLGFYTPSFSHKYIDDIDVSPKLQFKMKRKVSRNYHSETPERPANAPIPKYIPAYLQMTPVNSALRCHSKGRGSLYDGIVGICCHFCRQKKLCGEPDCERCGHRDVTKSCLGKTDCSRCHSSTGVFCRACLKIRYGEEMEEVRQKGDWICPHCVEEEGSNPYWICNSSICLAKRKVAPTGIAIFKAREMGYKSVAHYFADILKKRDGCS